MAIFLDKALEAVSSARDFAVVLLGGGAMYLGDGVYDVLHHVEPSAAGLGTAALCLGVAKAVDAVRARPTSADRKRAAAEVNAQDVLTRSKRLLMYFEAEKDFMRSKRLRKSIALFEAGAIPLEDLDQTFRQLASEAGEA